MSEKTFDQARAEHNARMEAKMFAPGQYVMLHHECKIRGNQPHPDVGRIGRIQQSDSGNMIVEFWNDDLVGSSTYCVLTRPNWLPVPEFCVEKYEPRAKRRGWRLNERGVRLFRDMGWTQTAATTGQS